MSPSRPGGLFTEHATAQPASAAAAPDAARVSGIPLDSQTLLQGQRTITIVHNGEVYRLQATRLGKLILTK